MSLNELERANLLLKETYNYINGIIKNAYKPWIQGISTLRLTRLTLLDWPYYASFHSCTIAINGIYQWKEPNGMKQWFTVHKDGE